MAKQIKKLEDLTPDSNNFNRHTEFGSKLLEDSLRKFGAGRSILVDKDGNIIAGNGVTETAAAIGMDDVEVVRTDGKKLVVVQRTDLSLDSPEGRELALADNMTALKGIDIDLAKVQEMLGDDLAKAWGMELPKVAPEAKEDDFNPEAPVETVCQKGDIWKLGNHRLMCGDSTDAGDVALLMDGERAELLLTDPPYGIKADKGVGGFGVSQDTARKYSDQWDEATPSQETFAYLLAATDNQIIFGGNFFTDKLPIGTAWIVWDKVGDIKFQNPYSDCELAWTSFAKVITKKYTTIQQGFVAEEKDDRVHPTQKPVKLIAAIMQDFSQDGDLILDTFGGSGSTLIAAEQLNRRCYMMELDPHYCDVIIARWEQLTNQKAERITP